MYLPVVISTTLALSWAWVDTGAKRAEPYFQLSKEGGEYGGETLMLDYATDFLPLVPMRATKRR